MILHKHLQQYSCHCLYSTGWVQSELQRIRKANFVCKLKVIWSANFTQKAGFLPEMWTAKNWTRANDSTSVRWSQLKYCRLDLIIKTNIPFHRMMNFNFPMVEIPFPDIPVYILFYFSKADGHLYSKFGDLKPPIDRYWRKARSSNFVPSSRSNYCKSRISIVLAGLRGFLSSLGSAIQFSAEKNNQRNPLARALLNWWVTCDGAHTPRSLARHAETSRRGRAAERGRVCTTVRYNIKDRRAQKTLQSLTRKLKLRDGDPGPIEQKSMLEGKISIVRMVRLGFSRS